MPNWYNPQYLNRYSYVLNNPLKYTDPTGHGIDRGDPYYNEEMRTLRALYDLQKNGWDQTKSGFQEFVKAYRAYIFYTTHPEQAAVDYVQDAKRKDRSPYYWATLYSEYALHQLFQPWRDQDILALMSEASQSGDTETWLVTTGIVGITLSTQGDNKFQSVDGLSQEIVDWLGSGARMIKNKNGGWIFISQDETRRVRFDFQTPRPHQNPHGHVEEKVNGVWVKSGPLYPTDVEHK